MYDPVVVDALLLKLKAIVDRIAEINKTIPEQDGFNKIH